VQDRSAIAVLPFRNLSAEGPHSYFAGGLHDELLTQLAKVGALKVISRTSVMGYQGTSKLLKQVAGELGVGSVVEGSVQVLGERLRVNVQLIDAATDEHLWAEHFDRTLDDAFAIQSEVAQQVVGAVGAALTHAEQGRLAAVPTANAEAYRLYLQGRDYYARPGILRQDREAAEQRYERALALDPDFALAHAELSQVHGQMFWMRFDPSPSRAARQREEAETALRLAPDLPQAHFAMGRVHYQGRRDYRRALDEYAIALKGAPNDAELWRFIGVAHRRLGNWSEVLAAFEKSAQLDPRDANLFYFLGGHTFQPVRRYADAVHAYDRALSLAPDLHAAAIDRGWTYVRWQGQLDTLRSVLSRLPSDADLGSGGGAASQRAALLLWERNADDLLQMPQIIRGDVFAGQDFFLPGSLYAAWAHELRRDRAAARVAFDVARVRLDFALRELPDDWPVHAARGLALAGLGRRDEAREEARWLQQSVIYREDAWEGPELAENRAQILAQAGDADSALDEIERLLAGPSWLSVHGLRLYPLWDPLREQPRFKALLAKYGKGEVR
jgi:TolB-like protein/Flp pilus assembly protein TadD